MPTTLTLKNIPADVYEQLRTSAKTNLRSINNEAIVCFRQVLFPAQGASAGKPVLRADRRLAKIRKLRSSLGSRAFSPEEIDAFKREGRP